MGSTENGEKKQQVFDKDGLSASRKLKDFIPIDIAMGLDHTPRKKRFLDFLKARPAREWFLKSGIVGRLSPYSFLKRNGSTTKGSSPPDRPLGGGGWRRPFRVPFVRNIKWAALIKYCKNWAKHPMNMAMLVWLFFVATGLITLVLLMTGLLNGVITDSKIRTRWTEIMNQILNALFTIMCLYQHPKIFHHLTLLCRWAPTDIVEVRKVYCKDGGQRPHERAHIMFVVILLHVTCFSQYILCGLYWGFTSKTRPDWANYLLVGLGTISPIIAALYTFYGPLGKKYWTELDEETQRQESAAAKLDADSLRQYSKRVVVTSPEWVGGLFDLRDDLTVSYMSFFCTFCVFGWNMERIGFGNMYVHVATFILLCVSPFWVFYVSALNINDDTTRLTVRILGIVLCFFGLFYGGFWRVQMRKKFKLPANPLCCGFPAVTDFMQWLFCWSCSLAQEVRTVNFYDVDEESFYMREDSQRPAAEEEESRRPALVPLPREGGSSFKSSGPSRSGGASPSVSMATARDSSIDGLSITIDEELPVSNGEDIVMIPPLPPLIQLQDNQKLVGTNRD